MSNESRSVEQRVVGIVAEHIGRDPDAVNRDQAFEELGIDSLDALEVLFQIEEEFDVTIPDELAADIRTVGEVIDGLEKVVSGTHPGTGPDGVAAP